MFEVTAQLYNKNDGLACFEQWQMENALLEEEEEEEENDEWQESDEELLDEEETDDPK